MQDMDSFYETAIRRGHHIEGSPLVVAEWNFNNIFDPTVVNLPDDQNWSAGNKYFPPKSVANSIRPNGTGIFAAFCDEAYTVASSTANIESSRFYTVGGDKDSLYAYWICPTPSSTELVGATGIGEVDSTLDISYAVSRGELLLTYPGYINSNKVSVLFNLGSMPTDWSIFLHTQGAPGDGYIEISNPTIDEITGRCEIWWNGTSWIQTQQLDADIFAVIDKIKVEVRAIDSPASRLQVVEVAARREIDLSDRIEEYDVNFQMDDVDFIHPVGKMCAGDGRITFNNSDLKINEQDQYSDFYGLLSGRCEYRTYVKYNLEDYGGTTAIMRTGTMFANDWQQLNEYQYQVEIWDILKLLQITKVAPQLFENISVARIISNILDSVAVDSYNLNASDFDSSTIVKYFWMDGQQNAFDTLDSLCQSSQSALYADEFGIIQLLTRNDITDETVDPIWTFRGEKVGDDLADIITLKKKFNLQANDVTIKYNQMEAPVDALDITSQPLTSKVWEEDDTVVLRAAALLKTISQDGLDHLPDSQKDIWISSTQVELWPYKSTVNIDGELIQYDGKGYQKWNYATDPPTVQEIILHNDDDKKAADKETWLSFTGGVVGGTSTDPSKQNTYTGRLSVTTRDSSESGRQDLHPNYWNYGWMAYQAWLKTPGNGHFPDWYVEPGGSASYSMSNLQNYKTRTNWNSVQTRWTTEGSILKCAQPGNSGPDPAILVRDLGDTEYREMGTRLRLDGSGYAGLIFYLSDAEGYDNENPTLTDPALATRFYALTVILTEEVEKSGRQINEIYLEVKNGDVTTPLGSFKDAYGNPIGSEGKWQIDRNKWYDIDVIVKDGPSIGDGFYAGITQIEVYIDGQWVDTFMSEDNIRPTGLVGVQARWSTVAEFEQFYATTIAGNTRPTYPNDEMFDFEIYNLASGTNVTKVLNFEPSTNMQSVLTLSTYGADATISSLKIKSGNGELLNQVKQLGPITVKPDTRIVLDFNASVAEITYTASNGISVCWEHTDVRNFPYSDQVIVTPDNSFYDEAKLGYYSNKLDDLSYINPVYPYYWTDEASNYQDRQLFHDDFGSIVHEVREFDVEYDAAPAKGVRVYVSNEKVKVVALKYNPMRGIFTLANASHRDEIANGTEEIDESNSIDHSLMMYGYILEDKGEKTKVVKDEGAIRRHGPVAINLDASWIFTEQEAEALGNWIVEHWSDPMDTIALDVFSNTFSQIGDKVNVIYSNANIDEEWIYIVSDRSVSLDDTGLSTSVTLRRVR